MCFIPHPPSLQHEPPLEAYKTKHLDDAKPSQEIRQLLDKSHMGGQDGTFTKEEAKEWLALLAVHEEGRLHANALPHLPHTQAIPHNKDSQKWLGLEEHAEHSFEGTPRLLRSMLKDMMRFPRPLITWDIFNEAPPTSWPNPLKGKTNERLAQPADSNSLGAKRPRRDPAEANSVEHLLYTGSERRSADKDLLNTRWAEDLPGHVEVLEDGCFYLVRLEQGTKEEPWMAMGIVQVRRDGGESGGGQKFFWLGRSSQGTNPWPTTVTFKPWPGAGAQQARNDADIDEAICKITDEWLPKEHSLSSEGPTITINSEFRKRLELFGRLHELVNDGALVAQRGQGRAKATDAKEGDTSTHQSSTATAEDAPSHKRKRQEPQEKRQADAAPPHKRKRQEPQEKRQADAASKDGAKKDDDKVSCTSISSLRSQLPNPGPCLIRTTCLAAYLLGSQFEKGPLRCDGLG